MNPFFRCFANDRPCFCQVCFLCDPGTYSNTTGLAVCPKCPLGRFSNRGASNWSVWVVGLAARF